ncbi:MAG: hypothetical protein Kow0074_21970 [Candidatus Zixiibacteriota bacterium]
MRQVYSARKLLALFILVMSAGLGSNGCQQDAQVKQRPPVTLEPPWVVLYAFDAEGEKLRDWIPLNADTVWAGRRIATGRLVQPVVLAASGMGMSNAAATAQYVIDRYRPKGIIFTGICGALDPQLHIGDIVIPGRWITHDYGHWGKQGFRTDSIPVGRTDSVGFDLRWDLPVDTNLFRLINEAADRIDFRFEMVAQRLPEVHIGGIGVSGDAFIDSRDKRMELQNEFQAQIVDMESAAVVQTAHANGVPVVVIRSCSDLAGGSGSETASAELNDFSSVAAQNSALVVREFLENPEEPPGP